MTPLSLLDPPPDDDQPAGTMLLPAPAGWPAPPDRAVYHELLGEIINRITPHTEADPVAILTQLLVAFGAAVGRGAWFQVEATPHYPNEYICLVGDTARSRKGSSWDHVRRLIIDADPSLEPRVLTGLSSGEGVIWAVRDPTAQDPGIPDQRLLVIEPEFASTLKAAGRELSTLSPTLRTGWDGRPLAILTRTAPPRRSPTPRPSSSPTATSPGPRESGDPYDFVIADFQMPIMDGATLAKAIKADPAIDRKSTRLNSSHLGISYAVFC